jgi:hypothetical protein
VLTNELPPDPVVLKINVGPRLSRSNQLEPTNVPNRAVRSDRAWSESGSQPPMQGDNAAWKILGKGTVVRPADLHDTKAGGRSVCGATDSTDLAQLLSEARASANDYGAMKARTRKALYEALGRAYAFAIYADERADEYAHLLQVNGLTVQDRAPNSPIVKLVFGAEYDRTRIAEFAAAIAYGRRTKLLVEEFVGFLNEFEGGLKAVVGLERLRRKVERGTVNDGARIEARPAIARKLREIVPKDWDELSSIGDEFTVLVARRLPDGRVAMVGEVPRDIALLEKVARKLLEELQRSGTESAEQSE